MIESKIKKILIIDDSLLVRNIIADIVAKEADLDVIATGKTGLDCVELAKKLRPDLIILDIEMPVLDGLSALDELKKLNLKIPVIMLSVLTQHGADATFKALEKGAIDFIPKPSAQMQVDPKELGRILVSRVRGYFEGLEKSKAFEGLSAKKESTVLSQNKGFQKKDKIEAICIGTSTGGPKALHTVLMSFPADFSLPILVVQHMPQGFTKAFAERLDSLSKLRVKEAEHNEIVQNGTVYIAAGDHQMTIVAKSGGRYIQLDQNAPQINGHRPSIEVLFDSARSVYGGSHLVGVIMTGMGKDGSLAIKRIHDEHGYTIAQDEESSIIFGMNRQAIEMGGIERIVPLDRITNTIVDSVKQRG
jgi:two-component system, chemotaxis family, protein-glutamate methylesterase/glutaminase